MSVRRRHRVARRESVVAAMPLTAPAHAARSGGRCGWWSYRLPAEWWTADGATPGVRDTALPLRKASGGHFRPRARSWRASTRDVAVTLFGRCTALCRLG